MYSKCFIWTIYKIGFFPYLVIFQIFQGVSLWASDIWNCGGKATCLADQKTKLTPPCLHCSILLSCWNLLTPSRSQSARDSWERLSEDCEKCVFFLKTDEMTQVSKWIINSILLSNQNNWKTTSVIHSYFHICFFPWQYIFWVSTQICAPKIAILRHVINTFAYISVPHNFSVNRINPE